MAISKCHGAEATLIYYTEDIEGLGEKLEDEKFLEIIQKFDFITLVETWKPEHEKISIDNFYSYSKCRSKHKKAKRHFGDITVLIKNDIRKGVKFFSSKSDRLVWCKLERSFINLEEDIYVCSVYSPPKNSKRKGSENDSYPYSELQNGISKYAALGQIILMGDFNARKGSLDDTVGPSNLPFSDLKEESMNTDADVSFRKCVSRDMTINTYGRHCLICV